MVNLYRRPALVPVHWDQYKVKENLKTRPQDEVTAPDQERLPETLQHVFCFQSVGRAVYDA